MENFFAIIVLSIVIEGIVTYIRTWFVDKHFQWQQALTCVLGILIALAYQADLLALMDIKAFVPAVGEVLTGILLSRGSNYIFDLIKRLSGDPAEMTVKEFQEEEMKG